jgi:hypothetical protein
MLIDEIKQVDATNRELEFALRDMHKHRDMLYGERASCDHVFTPPLKNYEHEGGECKICGIGELHAVCQKIGKSYTRQTDIKV